MMRAFRHLVLDLAIIATVIAMGVFLYQSYGDRVINYLLGDGKVALAVREITVIVTIADTDAERQKGLAGVESMPANEGKLFVFDREGKYGFWMKDTLIPLDIIWIDNNRKVVHIEKNVRPESYPTTYNTPVPARFVLEVNAFYTTTFNVNVGDTITIPASSLPKDLR